MPGPLGRRVRGFAARWTLWIVLLVGLTAFAGACEESLQIETRRFACSTDGDCLAGYRCVPAGDGSGLNACVAEGEIDVVGDTTPDTDVVDGGDTADTEDVEVVSCTTDQDCRDVFGEAPCVDVTCEAGTCSAPVIHTGTSCDDENLCTRDDECTASGACEGTFYLCESQYSCRQAICDGTGGCTYETDDDKCLIAETCRDAGEANSTDPCSICDPAESQIAWTALSEGAGCDLDGDPCTTDTCKSGTCLAGATVDCDDDLDCTADSCEGVGEGATCVNTPVDACVIDGACVAVGERKSDDPCQWCDPDTNPEDWTLVPNGTECELDGDGCTVDTCTAGICAFESAYDCDDSLDCTQDACASLGDMDRECSHTPEAGSCYISGACYAADEVDASGCGSCQPDQDQTGFTGVDDDTPCNADDDGCTIDSCQAGVCTAGPAPTCDDGLSCTTDFCVSTGADTHDCDADVTGCFIADQCYDAGEPNPSNPCEVCAPANSTSAWTPTGDGGACDQDGDPCTQDTCQSGVCTLGPEPDCDDGLSCTDDVCQPKGAGWECANPPSGTGCVLNASCVTEGTTHPDNPCLECSGGTFEPKNASTPCNADDDGCTDGDHCQSGSCVPGPAVDCDTGKTCLDSACQSTGNFTHTCVDTVVAGTCHIANTCYADGDPNTNVDCQVCDADQDSDGWSPAPAGTSCASGSGFCGGGSCVVAPMVTIPAGTFWMGCNDGACDGDESPFHEVTVPEYRIDTTEVKVSQYQACVTAGACSTPFPLGNCNWGKSGKEGHPVNCVDLGRAQAFCAFVGKRLCSEAEWEKAARGGCDVYGANCGSDESVYPWGDTAPTCTLANFSGCENDTLPASSSGTGDSPYGVKGMAGNVSEWIADCEHADYVGAPVDGSVWSTSCASSNIGYRGGGYASGAKLLRNSERTFANPAGAAGSIGFRCCAD